MARSWLKVPAALSAALCAAFAASLLPGVRPAPGPIAVWDTWVYDAVSVTATLVCLGRGLLARPGERTAWVVFGLALMATTGGDVTWSVLSARGEPGTPSLADVGWLGFYPLAYAGLVALTRARMPAAAATSWLDGALSGLAAASVVAALAWDTIASGAVGGPLSVATALAYPSGDLLLVILVLGSFALLGWRPGRGLVLIAAGLLAWGVADTIYLYETARGTYVEGRPLDLLWPLGMVLLALGALQPDGGRARASQWAGFAVPPLAALTAAAVLAVSALGRGHDVAVVLAAAAVAAAVVRTLLALRATLALAATRQLALTDELTGLANRRALFARLEEAIAQQQPIGVLLFDLDRFKEINDTLGHATGDEVLRRLAPRLAELLRPGDMLARLGGDEFAVTVEGARDERAVDVVAERLRAALEEPIELDGRTTRVGASFGIALYPDQARDAGDLLSHADTAMYEAKSHRPPLRRRSGGAPALLDAIAAGELELHLQPLVEPAAGTRAGGEALLRWHHPRRGLLPAADFLPGADDATLRAITDHVLALAQDLPRDIAVNLAAADVLDDTLPERLAGTGALRLEVPPLAPEQLPRATAVLERVRALGHELTLDGAGGDWLALAARLPVSRVNVDGRFADGPRAATVARAILDAGRALGVQIAVTRVETPAARALLEDAGVPLIAGFAVAPPVPASELTYPRSPCPPGRGSSSRRCP